MSILVKKEVRLLLPGFVTAVALAALAGFLRPDLWTPFAGVEVTTQLLWLGILLMGLSSIGREISFRTLSLMLAQPMERRRIWRTKIGVLGCALALALGISYLAESFHGGLAPTFVVERLHPAFPLALVAGCLWLTLLLRQVIAAFWLALLIPMFLEFGIGSIGGVMGMNNADGYAYVTDAVLFAYAIAGFFYARWLFLRAQDTAWGGEALSIELGIRRTAVEGKRERSRRPWVALLAKEFRLQQFALAGMLAMLILDFAGATARRVEGTSMRKSTELALEAFAFLWVVVPVFIGCQSVAEERKMGVMEPLLCLPVSRRWQWFIKLLFTLVIGGWLSGTLFWTLENWAQSRAVTAEYWNVVMLSVAFAGIGFYASTLARETHQALAVGVCAAFGIWGGLFVLARLIWQTQSVALFVGVEVVALVAALLALSYRNFGALSDNWRAGARNIGVIAAVLICVFGLALGAYDRVWEFAMPEPGPGPARFSLGNPPKLRAGYGLALLLPDGRLWTGRWAESYGRSRLHDLLFGGTIMSAQTDHFAAGSNWVDAVLSEHRTIAIRADGTAWVSKNNWEPSQTSVAPLVRLDSGTSWRRVASRRAGGAFLLKNDETLWSWSGFIAEVPMQGGTNADWNHIVAGGLGGTDLVAWKNDGSAWSIFGRYIPVPAPATIPVLAPATITRNKRMDGEALQALAFEFDPIGQTDFGVREDGALWIWEWVFRPEEGKPFETLVPKPAPTQIGTDTNWTSVASVLSHVIARKSDGTLWRLSRSGANWQAERIGTRSDWLAVGVVSGGVTALAADGSIWRWQTERFRSAPWASAWLPEARSEGLLGPSRRPELIGRVE